MSLFTGGDGPNVKDSSQVCLVKIVKALTEPVSAAAGEISSYPALGTANVFAASAVVKTTGAVVYRVLGYNANASTRYLQVFDANALPANGATPLAVLPLTTKTNGTIDFGQIGLVTKTGLVVALSTTDQSLTVTGTADGLFNVLYV